MLFNSIEFLIFLPLVFLLYWYAFGRNTKLQNIFIVIASYVFYGWWDWRFLFLIALSTVCSFVAGFSIEHYREKRVIAKSISIANIVINLSILGVFKYYNFFADSLQSLFSSFGCQLDHPTLNIILPVGISFYTFQALSYSIDVYRNKIEATKDIFAFFAFISFFPQLVAGPIEKATNLLPQFQRKRTFDYTLAVDGCRQMLWGFFKKIVIADSCAYYANMVFDNHNEADSLTLLFGAVFFTFQIYGDFSGYSSIAIGCAKWFGIRLQPNFRVPYFSRDIAEFWKRWHISLNKWFVDYLYVPLGGSKGTKSMIVRNTFAIFLLSALWHGANWTYVAWGFYHACLFVPLIVLGKNRRYRGSISEGSFIPPIRDLCSMIATFVFVMVGWIVFRAKNIKEAYDYILRLFSFEAYGRVELSLHDSSRLFLLIGFMLLVEWWNRNAEHEFYKTIANRHVMYAFYLLLIVVIYYKYALLMEADNAFIYFQF